MPRKHGHMSHEDCDHPATPEARGECRIRMKEEDPEEYERRRQVSMAPVRVRDRARYHAQRASEELALVMKPVDEWDYEELAHGRPRDKNGGFTGSERAIISREVHREAMRRFELLLQSKVRVVSSPAVEVLMRLMNDEETPPATRASIGFYLVDRVLGKPTTPVETSGGITHQIEQILATSVVHPGEDPARVIEAEVVDEDEDDIPSEGSQPTFPELTIPRQPRE